LQFLQNQDLASFQDTKITTFFHFLFFIVKEIYKLMFERMWILEYFLS